VGTDSKYFYGDEGRVECHKGTILAILATFGLFWLLLGSFWANLANISMDYVRHGEIQSPSLVFFKRHCPCILPSLCNF
jgi:hypothetical protein